MICQTSVKLREQDLIAQQFVSFEKFLFREVNRVTKNKRNAIKLSNKLNFVCTEYILDYSLQL